MVQTNPGGQTHIYRSDVVHTISCSRKSRQKHIMPNCMMLRTN